MVERVCCVHERVNRESMHLRVCECSLVPLGLCVTLKTWKWPGKEAKLVMCLRVYLFK